jgi:tripartite-type tricarboxylate transporter receptor subunit TctC
MSPRASLLLGRPLVALAFVVAATVSCAQSFPARPLRLIIGQAPGGQSDVLGRIVAQRFSEILKHPVVVENRGGSGGTIAAEQVAKAPADGYTILFAGSSNLSLAAVLVSDLRYSLQDFAPIGAIARVQYGLAVRAELPSENIAELIAYAREHPGELNYATSGITSASSLLFEMLKRSAKIDMVHIPYKGSAAAVSDLLSGRVDLAFTDVSLLVPLVAKGALRLIAVAGAKRSPAAPDVQTVAEQGYPELDLAPWYGLVVPAGTPPEVTATLEDALIRTLRTPEVRAHFDRLGYAPFEATPEQLADLLRAEVATFSALVEEKHLQPQR